MLNVAIVKGLRSSRQFQQHVPKPVTFNLALPLAVELTFSNQITSQQPIQSRSNPQRLNSNASFSFWPTKSLFNATPWVFVASWCLRIPKVKRKFISPDTLLLVKVATLLVSALYVLQISQWIPMLENYAPSFLMFDAKETGTELFYSVTQPLILWSCSKSFLPLGSVCRRAEPSIFCIKK